MNKRSVKKGIYLVVDPSTERSVLLGKLHLVLNEKIAALQIWDNFMPDGDCMSIVCDIAACCRSKNIPVLINNRWDVLKQASLDGIHLDAPVDDIALLRKEMGRPVITGVTCGNDLSVVQWAEENRLDYISFCSLFPSASAGSCELVSVETIQKARQITSLPIFLAGGIQPGNLHLLRGLPYSGIAVISGIMNAGDPAAAVEAYSQRINFNEYDI